MNKPIAQIFCSHIKLYTEGETSVEEKSQVAEAGSQEREEGRGGSWVSNNHKRERPLGEILSGDINNCMKHQCGLFPRNSQLNVVSSIGPEDHPDRRVGPVPLHNAGKSARHLPDHGHEESCREYAHPLGEEGLC